MSNPFKHIAHFLFGGGGGTQQPLLLAPQIPAPPGPVQAPQGTSSTNKNFAGPSFLSAAAAPAAQQQTAQKSLLGQ